ncbi:phage/plasmid primase, P4 family [bacterium]|nr:phage/plasmid primase, P4 family [bacterium]
MHEIDYKAIQEHLKFVDPEAEYFAFASYTESGRENKSNVSARLVGSLDQHRDQMQKFQDQFAALYFSVNAIKPGGSATKDDIHYVRALFIDMDDPSSTLDDVMACPLPVHRIVETSPGKHQCYWLVDDLTVEEAEGFTRWLVKRYQADRGVWDAARVFRLPGTWHLKGEPFMCRVVYTAKKVTPYSINQIGDAGIQWVPQQAKSKITDYTPPTNVDADKLVALVNGGDEQCLELWDMDKKSFNTGGVDGSRYHMAIASMIKKCRMPIEVFDVYLRLWVARHPEGDRQGKVDRPGYMAMTWAKNTMGVALRHGETWEGWRTRRDAVMALFDKGDIADTGEPDIEGLEAFLHGASDDALAIKAANSFGGNMRYTPQYGKWHLWDGVKWTEDTTGRAKDAVRAFLRTEAGIADEYVRDLLDATKGEPKARADDITKLAGKMKTLVTRLRKTKTLLDVMTMLILEFRSGAEIVMDHSDWDQHNTLIATAGGVIDLTNGKTMADGRRFYCSRATLVAPDDEGKPVKWLKFLGQVFDDKETIDFVHRFFGYALTGYTREECFVFAYGNGRNGKGVLTNTIASVMGAYAKTVDADLFTLAGAGQHKSGLAALQGVRFALSSEIPDGASWNLQRIKTLTGGDVIEANFMRQNKFEFVPKLSLVICANDKPTLKSVDASVRARFRFLQFPNSFEGREDKGLKDDLRSEYPAIMRWLINGAVKYLKHGLSYPDTIKAATDEYLDEADTLRSWLEDAKWDDTENEPWVENSWFTAADLLDHYSKYCRSSATRAVGKYAFFDYLRTKGFEKQRKSFKYRYTGQVWAWGPFRDIKSNR